jgi:hypothetical protein
MTWTSRVWFARNAAGRRTRTPSSLAQMARAFQQGVLGPDAEVAVAGDWVWENVRQALARHASLAPPAGQDARDSGSGGEAFPELELTLTGQVDVPDHSDDVTRPASQAPVSLPPMPAPPASSAPTMVDERARRMSPTIPSSLAPPPPPSLVEPQAFEVAIPARLPHQVFLACSALAALALLLGVGLGIDACNERLVDAFDARTTLLAVLIGLGWVAGGVIVAAAIAVLGRAAAGVLQIAHLMERKTR